MKCTIWINNSTLLCVTCSRTEIVLTLMKPCWDKELGSFSFLFTLTDSLMNLKCGDCQPPDWQKGPDTRKDVRMSDDDTNQN